MEKIIYRDKEIRILGKGYLYGGWAFPTLAMAHQHIDNQIDSTQKEIIGQAYSFEKPKPIDEQ
jgi:hypothetical protein